MSGTSHALPITTVLFRCLDRRPIPTQTLGDRLAARRRVRFVGRARERDRLSAAFASGEPTFVVAHVHGPGGIGKSALLDEAAHLAGLADRAVARVDGRDIEASPAAFASVAAAALDRAGDGPRVLLVDTYERIEALDGWLRHTFIPTPARERPRRHRGAEPAGAGVGRRICRRRRRVSAPQPEHGRRHRLPPGPWPGPGRARARPRVHPRPPPGARARRRARVPARRGPLRPRVVAGPARRPAGPLRRGRADAGPPPRRSKRPRSSAR